MVMDFKKHNQEVRELWKTFESGNPIRVPVITGVSDRYFVLNSMTNPNKISFREYMANPDLMFEMQAEFDRYRRFHVVGDHMMGYPEEEEQGWHVNIDFQNFYEAAWYGCEVRFPQNQVPYAIPMLREDNREMLFEKGIPDPFSGIMGIGKEYYEKYLERMKSYVLDGYPVVDVGMPFIGSDGPFTVACELMGPAEICVLLYEDPEFVHQLMGYITEATIQRMKAWRKYLGQPEKQDTFFFADDSIMLLSQDSYKEFVLPYHRKLEQELSYMTKPGGAHLCGDSTRHFKTISEELNIRMFDTGFPVAHGELIKELGPEVAIYGGPPAELIRTGSREEIFREVQRILEEVKPYTKRFVLREGNDMAPYTPLENMEALYEAGKQYGKYEYSPNY